MQPLGVVNVVDEVIDAGAGISDGLEGACIQLLGLECLHETLGLGVVVRVAEPRHRDGMKGLVVFNGPEHYAFNKLKSGFKDQRSLTASQIRKADLDVKPTERLVPLTK